MIKSIAIASSLLATGFCFAANLHQGSWEADFVSSQNGQAKIKVNANNSIEFYLDNRCRFDSFGESGACTLNLIIPQPTIASYSYSSEDGSKKVYQIGNSKYLLVTIKEQLNRLLVKDEAGYISYSIPLKKVKQN